MLGKAPGLCFSVYSSVVGLHLLYSLFVIVPVLSLSCPGWLLENVAAAVKDVPLRLCEAENTVLLSLG